MPSVHSEMDHHTIISHCSIATFFVTLRETCSETSSTIKCHIKNGRAKKGKKNLASNKEKLIEFTSFLNLNNSSFVLPPEGMHS